MANAAVKSADLSLTLTRLIAAPLARVWRAFTDPAEASKWLGPEGWTGTYKSDAMDLGGRYTIEMRHHDGRAATATGVFREIVPMARLVYTWAWLGEDSKPGHQTLVIVTFKAVGTKTELTLHHEGFETADSRDNHNGGWTGCLEKLVNFIERETK